MSFIGLEPDMYGSRTDKDGSGNEYLPFAYNAVRALVHMVFADVILEFVSYSRECK